MNKNIIFVNNYITKCSIGIYPKEKLDVLKVNLDDVALNCGSFGYFYNVITSDDFVVPPT